MWLGALKQITLIDDWHFVAKWRELSPGLPPRFPCVSQNPKSQPQLNEKADGMPDVGCGKIPPNAVQTGETRTAAVTGAGMLERISPLSTHLFSTVSRFSQPLQLSALSVGPESGHCFHNLIEFSPTFDSLLC